MACHACSNIALGSVAYAGVYVVATVAFFPASLLTLGAGFTFSSALGQGVGVALATLVVFVGASVGGMLAFFLGRYVLRDTAAEWAKRYRVLGALDSAIGKSGLRLMVLLRLSPIVPFSAFNYVASITAISFRDFSLANVAILPGTAAYCYFGSLLTNVRETAAGHVPDPALQWTLIAIGVLATVGALVLITVYARREVRAALARVGEAVPADDGATPLDAGGAGAVQRVAVDVASPGSRVSAEPVR